MNIRLILLAVVLLSLNSCKQEMYLTKIKGERIEINDSIEGLKSIEDFVKPFRDHVNKNLDSTLAYAMATYTKNDGELNTAIGNFMADAVRELSNPIFNSRTGKNIDISILNHGGIRSIISQGNVTARTAYQIMPFENTAVVAELKGVYVKELVQYLLNGKRAHPISGLSIKTDQDFNLIEAKVGGHPIDDEKIYNVVTHDYLFNGGGNMNFFKQSENKHILDYKIRNILIDYFTKVDTLNLKADNRFIKIK